MIFISLLSYKPIEIHYLFILYPKFQASNWFKWVTKSEVTTPKDRSLLTRFRLF